MSKSKKKVNRTMMVLGRLVIDIRREQAGATFTVPNYPDVFTLRKMGLAAIGEIHNPQVLEILREASRRDSGVKDVVNDVLNNMIRKAEQADQQPKPEAPVAVLANPDLEQAKADFQAAVARHDALPESDIDGRVAALDAAEAILAKVGEEHRAEFSALIPEYEDKVDIAAADAVLSDPTDETIPLT